MNLGVKQEESSSIVQVDDAIRISEPIYDINTPTQLDGRKMFDTQETEGLCRMETVDLNLVIVDDDQDLFLDETRCSELR